MAEPKPEIITARPDLKLLLAGFSVFLVIALFAIWYLTTQVKPTPLSGTEKVATTASKKATSANVIDETMSWETLTNTTVGYIIKYPKDWLYNGTSSKPNCDDETVFFAPTKDLLGACASGFGGLVLIAHTQEGDSADMIVNNYQPTNYDDFKKENVTIGGKSAVKISGISKVKNEMVDNTGTKEIHYIFTLGKQALTVNYSQGKTTTDYSATFEKIVSTLKFL